MSKIDSCDRKSESLLCIDLDGTLLRTDMLVESLCFLLKRRPYYLFIIPIWLVKGRAYLKHALAKDFDFDPATLPYRSDILNMARSQYDSGREVVLATASDQVIAKKIADHLRCFSLVVASDGKSNLKGQGKLEALKSTFGGREFEYAGDSTADLSIWEGATKAIVVERKSELSKKIKSGLPIVSVQKQEGVSFKVLCRALRVHQWVKNLLIFLPLFLAHRAAEVNLLLQALVGFIAFSMCSSAVYLLNDLMDLDADRQHHSKRNRPLASGQLPIGFGFMLAPVLLIAAAILAVALKPAFGTVLCGYFILTTWYSLRLKQIVLVDILVLAGLYTVRIIAGGTAVSVAVSEWLLAFSMFFFLSLACVKRYSELLVLRQSNKQVAKGRGYLAGDLELIGQFGSASGYLSVLILALYVSSQEISILYRAPMLLWLLCPLILFWISRVWLLAHRGTLHDDPIVFAIRDRVSYLVGLLAAVVLLLAV